MTMRGSRGFLMIDVLVASLVITGTALVSYRIISVSLGVFGASRDLLMISAAADDWIVKERLETRNLSNPDGVPADEDCKTIGMQIMGRHYVALLRKEVDRKCAGVSRWTITIEPEAQEGCFQKLEALCYVAGAYDPF